MTRNEALDCIRVCQDIGTYDFAQDVVVALAVLLVLQVMQKGEKDA